MNQSGGAHCPSSEDGHYGFQSRDLSEHFGGRRQVQIFAVIGREDGQIKATEERWLTIIDMLVWLNRYDDWLHLWW